MADPPVVSDLMVDVDQSLARRGLDRRAESLRQMTDLFVREAGGLDPARVEVFDEVIGRLAEGVDVGPRAELAARLADLPNAPPALVRRLAEDDLAVARPVLARSSRLSDGDLAAIAAAKGSGHLLAIAERDALGEQVTDALVAHGDRRVAHAVACHPGARLSEGAATALVDKASGDGTLRALLTGRADLGQAHQAQLAEARGSPDGPGALSLDVATPEGQSRFGRALHAVQTLADLRPLTEDDLVAFLEGGEVAEAVCTLALLAGLTVSLAVRLFEPGRTDLLLLLARSQGWSWPTAEALLGLQAGAGARPDPRLREVYAGLEPMAAARVVHVLTARTRQQRPEPRQIRSRVR